MKRIKHKALIAAAVIVTVALNVGAYAQGRGSGQAQGQAQGQGARQGQVQQQGSAGGAPQGRSGNAVTAEQRNEIRQRMRDADIFGGNLMTAEERRQYRDRVNSAASDREWAQIREQHINEMRARALSQGRPIEPPIYGEHMMTRQERNDYRERMESARSDAERARIVSEHRESIRQRATQLGLNPPAVD